MGSRAKAFREFIKDDNNDNAPTKLPGDGTTLGDGARELRACVNQQVPSGFGVGLELGSVAE